MSNSTMLRADRATHLKIVAVSVIAAMLVIGVGFAARPPGSVGVAQIGEDNAIAARMDDDALARMSLRSGQPSRLSNRETATIR